MNKYLLLLVASLVTTHLSATEVLPKQKTEITSDRVEMQSSDDYNIFNFYGNVHMLGDGIDATSDELEVISKKNPETSSSDIGDSSSVEKIIAKGNVVMEQENRIVRAGKAFIFPAEGKVVLEDKPEVDSKEKGLVKGHRIVFYKNDQKAYVEGGGIDGERPKIILPSTPNLNQSNPKEIAAKKTLPIKEKR